MLNVQTLAGTLDSRSVLFKSGSKMLGLRRRGPSCSYNKHLDVNPKDRQLQKSAPFATSSTDQSLSSRTTFSARAILNKFVSPSSTVATIRSRPVLLCLRPLLRSKQPTDHRRPRQDREPKDRLRFQCFK